MDAANEINKSPTMGGGDFVVVGPEFVERLEKLMEVDVRKEKLKKDKK